MSKEPVGPLKHSTLVVDNQRIEIDLLTSFRYDYICLFYVSGGGAGAMYYAHLDKETAQKSTSELLRYLLENLSTRKVKLIRSFALAV